ncbi:glycosyltransferase family 2 protein [Shimia aestuarii]|uniref:glycosyltransferase family 2 protein n=2 Tax=Shimia TaxID=573139 RepID=UPI001FB35CDF|nr:glycosyltransferase family 2 protein [Shimia aestuarii]
MSRVTYEAVAVASIGLGRGTSAPKVTVVSTMKDEGAYILDWVAHYRTLGATDIVVFTNDVSDPTDHILRRLNCMGEVHHRFNRVMRRGPHKSALMWAEHEPAVREADWILVVDVDEFLDIKVGDGTFQDLIAEHPEADAISFPWRIFGNAGVEKITGESVPRQFTKAQPAEGKPGEHRFFKTLFRNDKTKFNRMGVHRPFLAKNHAPIHWILPDGTRVLEDDKGGALHLRDHYGYEGAQLNHYALRSLDAFLNKQRRGRANHFKGTIEMGYWKKFDKNDEEDTSLAEKFFAAEAYRRRLLAQDEALARHHEAALDWAQRMARKARREQQCKTFLKALAQLDAPASEAARDVA